MIQNDEVEEYLRAVEGAARTAAVTAERGLRWISEADSVALYACLGRLMRWAIRTGEMRVLWNRILVLGRCRCGAESVRPWWTGCFKRLGDDAGLVRTMALQALFDLSASDTQLRNRVLPFAERLMEMGTAAT